MKEHSSRIEKLLTESNFSDKEIAIYLSTLEMGRGTVAEISRKAGINRSTGYVILDSLASKNLIGISGKEPKQEYMALSPEHLVHYITQQAEKHKDLAREATNILPELMTLHTKASRPRVRFYEGLAGLKEVYEDTLSSTNDIYSTSTYEEMHGTLPEYFKTYYKRRAKKKIFIHTFVADTPLARIRQANDALEFRDTSLVPQNDFPVPTDIEIYDDKIMIASWREKLGITIESKEIATTLRSVFKLALREAKRLNKEIKERG